MRQELVAEVEKTGSTLLQLLSSFTEKQLNAVPFEGSWTAGQVAEHIYKAGDCGIVYGNTVPTNREPDEKVKAIKEMFLNFDAKMKSPEFVLPDTGFHGKDKVLERTTATWNKLTEAAKTVGLTDTCTDFVVEGFGPFTRLEWIEFINVHTRRHIHQLENIKQKLVTA